MTLTEFVKTRYDIRGTVKYLLTKPEEVVANSDVFPYDRIAVVEGELQKCVEREDGSLITVMDLISYVKEDVAKVKDKEFCEIYATYYEAIEELNDCEIGEFNRAREACMQSLERKKRIREKR